MTLRASDIIPISEARARLTELAEDVVGSGAEKVLTKNGSSYVALVDAKKLDYYHALELEHAGLILLAERPVRVGDVIEVKESSKQLAFVLEANQLAERDVPDYITVDHNKQVASYMRVPTLSDVPFAVQMEPNLVVEFYSR